MSAVVIVDTSVFLNVLDVPGFRWVQDPNALAATAFTIELGDGEAKSLDVRLERAGWVRLQFPGKLEGEPRFSRDGVSQPFGSPATGEERAWSGCLAPGDYVVEVTLENGRAVGRVTVVAGQERAVTLAAVSPLSR